MKFPLSDPADLQANISLDDLVFRNHYEKLEGRRNLWQKAIDRMKKLLS
jgi:hypothetical protein